LCQTCINAQDKLIYAMQTHVTSGTIMVEFHVVKYSTFAYLTNSSAETAQQVSALEN
jgi:hypothetical protein